MSYSSTFGEMCTDWRRFTTYRDPINGQIKFENNDGDVWLIVENTIGQSTITTRVLLDERDVRRIGAFLEETMRRTDIAEKKS